MTHLAIKQSFIVVLALFACGALPLSVTASAVVNSVSATAVGGESTVTVKTIINGELVEDRTVTGSSAFVNSKHVIGDEVGDTQDEHVSLESVTEEEKRRMLQALIEELRALIEMYAQLQKTL